MAPAAPSRRYTLWFGFGHAVQWAVLGTVIGLVVGLAFTALVAVIRWTEEWRAGISPAWLIFLLLPLGGLIVGFLRWTDKHVPGDGVQVYIRMQRTGVASRRLVAPLRFLATVATVGTGGSGGLTGPSMLVGARLALVASELRPLRNLVNVRICAMCGAASAVSALFGAPVGGALLAAEVLFESSIEYPGLFAAMIAATAAAAVRAWLLGPFALGNPTDAYAFTATDAGMLALCAVITGLVGLLFAQGHNLALRFRTGKGGRFHMLVAPVVGGAIASAAALAVGRNVLGTSQVFLGLWEPRQSPLAWWPP